MKTENKFNENCLKDDEFVDKYIDGDALDPYNLHQKGKLYDKLKEQRDELLEALKEIENNFSNNSDMYSHGYMHKRIKQLIKSTEND